MAGHNELGQAGEEAAVAYLEKRGYVIRHRNWRKGRLELDIVAARNNTLIVVEVKTRKGTTLLPPYESVNAQKIKHIVQATDTYIKLYQIDAPVRFDIVSVVEDAGKFKIKHIKEAFFPPIF